jgi:hypothetical protein
MRGGYLGLPFDGYSNVFAFHILTFAIPTGKKHKLTINSPHLGFLVGIIMKEEKGQDQFYVRRASLALMAFLLLWFSSYIDYRTYQVHIILKWWLNK